MIKGKQVIKKRCNKCDESEHNSRTCDYVEEFVVEFSIEEEITVEGSDVE